jgi:hypothetical protein
LPLKHSKALQKSINFQAFRSKQILAPHPHKRLTDAFARKCKQPAYYCDGGGLYLKVDQNRSKRWELNCIIDGKRRYLGLGSINDVTLAQAREEAQRLRSIRQRGGDVLAERCKRSVPTFEQAARMVHEACRFIPGSFMPVGDSRSLAGHQAPSNSATNSAADGSGTLLTANSNW